MSPQEVAREVVAWPVRLWRWSGRQKTSYRTATVVFFCLGGLFVIVRDNDADANARDTAIALYQAEVGQYENDRDEWSRCLSAAENRSNNRDNWYALYDAFEAYLDENARPIVVALRTDFDARTPPLDPADCGAEPIPPTPPEE